MRHDLSVGDNHERKDWYLKNFSGVDVIVELGVATGHTAKIFMECATTKVYGIDIEVPPLDELMQYADTMNVEYQFIHSKTTEVSPIDCDILFVDADHTEDGAYADLEHFSPKVKRLIALHDTNPVLRKHMPDLNWGVDLAIDKFLENNSEWEISYQDFSVCGLTVLARK